MKITVPKSLLDRTFRIEHSPNCPTKWLVRLVGNGEAIIDGLPYTQWMNRFDQSIHGELTRDALGFGKTLNQAAKRAIKAKEKGPQ
jgi:hypothetical protein